MDQKVWLKNVLWLAAAYNLLWGAWVVLFPFSIFDLLEIERPNYPQIWQCVGMIVGVYGIGYAIAATDYLRHWPIVLVGFLGKIFGPIGFLQAAFIDQTFPESFLIVIIFNDLIWWIHFALILCQSLHHDSAPPKEFAGGISTALSSRNWMDSQKRLFVFLRHQGCTFCRDTLVQLSRLDFAPHQIELVFVTMSDENKARSFISSYGLRDFQLVSDPTRTWYKTFLLQRATWSTSFHPRIWWRAVRAILSSRVGVGLLDGDGFQLGGFFLIQSGKVLKAHRSKDVTDLPDWNNFFS
jgi:hypothetical protein